MPTASLTPALFQANTNSSWTSPPPGLTTVGMPQAIFQWILVIAMMFSSLIVAQKFGVEGAKGARSILGGWGTATKIGPEDSCEDRRLELAQGKPPWR